MIQQLDPITVTIPEASRLTNLSVTTLYGKMTDGTLESAVIGKRRLIFYRSLVAMVEGGRSTPADTRPNWKPPAPRRHMRRRRSPA